MTGPATGASAAAPDAYDGAPVSAPDAHDGAPVLAWSPELVSYDFGVGHPMAPVRLLLTHALMADLGLTDRFRTVAAPVADDATLTLVHEPEYVDAVRRAQETRAPIPERGLGDEDTPVFGAVHDASARIVGATVAAAEEVWSGRAKRALSVAGGMHHAMPGRAAGFCVYNDCAVAIQRLLDLGARRIVYVDLDAHHGDGVERAFWADDRVLTISIHQHPATLFPGTGYAQDVGGAEARGWSANVALPPETSDADWLRAVEAVVEPLVREVGPEVLVTQHGADGHARDPLTHLQVSIDAQREGARLMAELADTHAGGRWVATGGGGYEVVNVVPRAWTHLAGIVAGAPVEPDAEVPESWRAHVEELVDGTAPRTMTDGGQAAYKAFWTGYDPSSEVDRAIMATRSAVFPWHGLDPTTA